MKFELKTPNSLASNEYLDVRVDEIEIKWASERKDPLQETINITLKEATKSKVAYLRYGMYWWAVKDVLKRHNAISESKEVDNELVKGIYSGRSDLETLVLAFMFSVYYDRNLYQGTRDFQVNEDETYVLMDDDMELS